MTDTAFEPTNLHILAYRVFTAVEDRKNICVQMDRFKVLGTDPVLSTVPCIHRPESPMGPSGFLLPEAAVAHLHGLLAENHQRILNELRLYQQERDAESKDAGVDSSAVSPDSAT